MRQGSGSPFRHQQALKGNEGDRDGIQPAGLGPGVLVVRHDSGHLNKKNGAHRGEVRSAREERSGDVARSDHERSCAGKQQTVDDQHQDCLARRNQRRRGTGADEDLAEGLQQR